MIYNPEKHNRKSIRLKGYDYSSPGYYYVTICTKKWKKWFGFVESEKIIHNHLGKLIHSIWSGIPNHYENTDLDQYIIMPNHIHGIIVINESDKFNVVGTEHCSVPTNKSINYGLLSKIVKSFKEISKKTIRKQFNNYEFEWQRSFYDHIIRSESSLNNIRKYIINNPIKWEMDKDNPVN